MVEGLKTVENIRRQKDWLKAERLGGRTQQDRLP